MELGANRAQDASTELHWITIAATEMHGGNLNWAAPRSSLAPNYELSMADTIFI